MTDALAATGEILTEHLWVELLLAAGAIVGAFLFFVLKGIRDNQTRIWDWARGETRIIEKKIDQQSERSDKELRDQRRWVRHEFRSMYGELIEITKVLGKHGADIERSIHHRLEHMADD